MYLSSWFVCMFNKQQQELVQIPLNVRGTFLVYVPIIISMGAITFIQSLYVCDNCWCYHLFLQEMLVYFDYEHKLYFQ